MGAVQWKLVLRWLGSAWQLLKVSTEETSEEELRLYGGEGLRSIVGSSEGGLMEEDSNFWTTDLQEVKVSWEVSRGGLLKSCMTKRSLPASGDSQGTHTGEDSTRKD